MTAPPRRDILVMATGDQIDAIAAIVGPNNIQHLVMGDNGIPTFWHEGPEILDQIAGMMPETERARLKSWDELDGDTQHRVVSHAAGCQEVGGQHWPQLLHDLPDFKDSLLRPA